MSELILRKVCILIVNLTKVHHLWLFPDNRIGQVYRSAQKSQEVGWIRIQRNLEEGQWMQERKIFRLLREMYRIWNWTRWATIWRYFVTIMTGNVLENHRGRQTRGMRARLWRRKIEMVLQLWRRLLRNLGVNKSRRFFCQDCSTDFCERDCDINIW